MTDNVLLEREAADMTVQLSYLPITELVILTVRCGDEQVAHTVEPQKALDAFNHPMCYLNPAEVWQLGVS